MAFTFNWAGVNIPTIQGGSKDYQQTIRSDAANWGNALKGYERRQADNEYADLLDKRDRISQIMARISALETRNQEIRQQIGAAVQTPVMANQPVQTPAFVSTEEHPTPTNYPYSNAIGG